MTKRRMTTDDSLGMTRARVAKRLGRHESWVRRHEGKDLHPTFVGGVYRFEPAEVDALATKLEVEKAALEASEAATVEIHRMFDAHLCAPTNFSVEGIAERTGVEPRVVRSMFTKWADEFLTDVPRLLSRKELHAMQEREEQQADREHQERMAEWAREDEERLKRWAADRKRRQREQDVADAARARARASRRMEWEASLAKARQSGGPAVFQDQITKIAEAKTLPELAILLAEICAGRR